MVGLRPMIQRATKGRAIRPVALPVRMRPVSFALANPRRAGRSTICRASWTSSRHSSGWLLWPDRSLTRAACLHSDKERNKGRSVYRPKGDQGPSGDGNTKGKRVRYSVVKGRPAIRSCLHDAVFQCCASPFYRLAVHAIYRLGHQIGLRFFQVFFPHPAKADRACVSHGRLSAFVTRLFKTVTAATTCASWPPMISSAATAQKTPAPPR